MAGQGWRPTEHALGLVKGVGEPILPPRLGSAGVEPSARPRPLSQFGRKSLKGEVRTWKEGRRRFGGADTEAGKQQNPFPLWGSDDRAACTPVRPRLSPRLCGRSEGPHPAGRGLHGRTPPGSGGKPGRGAHLLAREPSVLRATILQKHNPRNHFSSLRARRRLPLGLPVTPASARRLHAGNSPDRGQPWRALAEASPGRGGARPPL